MLCLTDNLCGTSRTALGRGARNRVDCVHDHQCVNRCGEARSLSVVMNFVLAPMHFARYGCTVDSVFVIAAAVTIQSYIAGESILQFSAIGFVFYLGVDVECSSLISRRDTNCVWGYAH